VDKFVLNLDDLMVDSFATAAASPVDSIDWTGCDSACTAC
jgi:hypothetical protein